MSDEIAEKARQALLGPMAETSVPFDELKPEIKERWNSVVDTVRNAHTQGHSPTGSREEWIEREAEAAGSRALRAVVARFAPPEYCPADVAFTSRVPELEKKIDNQRMSLYELHALREREKLERYKLELELKAVKAELQQRTENQRVTINSLSKELAALRSTATRHTGGDTEWKKKVDAAYDMVNALCRPRGSEGAREWLMSIPADPARDPDLVISDGLRAAVDRIRELESKPETRPVTVGWDVSAEEAQARMEKEGIRCDDVWTYKWR